MAKDCFEDVHRVIVIIVTLCVIVQTSMGNATLNTITIFAVAAANRSVILKRDSDSERGDFNIIVVHVHCDQVSRGTGAGVTTFKAGAEAIINSTSAGT